MKFVLSIWLLVASATVLSAQGTPKLDGRWEGNIIIPGQPMRIIVAFRTDGSALSATIDVPTQNATGLALTNVSQTGSKVHFELRAASGLATFDGEAAEATIRDEAGPGTIVRMMIRGEFKQANLVYKFELSPQRAEAEPPVPYRREAVKVKSGDATLAGTLTLPEGTGPFPAIVLVSDVGQQNRDGEMYGFKMFRLIADHFTRKGFAVLRCDDRGTGQSTGDAANTTTADAAKDVQAMLAYLRERKDLSASGIGLICHGEGATAAAMAAAETKGIGWLVLLGGSSIPGDRLVLARVEAAQRLMRMPAAAREDDIALQKRVFEAVRSGSGLDAIVHGVKTQTLERLKKARRQAEADMAKLPKDQQRPVPDTSEAALAAIDSQFAQVRTPWFRYFIDCDPATYMSKVTAPVLALFGELDSQVPQDANVPAMEEALKKGGNKGSLVRAVRSANHLFIQAISGSVEEYPALPKVFVPALLDAISDWVSKLPPAG